MADISFANPVANWSNSTRFPSASVHAAGGATVDSRPSGRGTVGGSDQRDEFIRSEHSRGTYSKKARPAETPQTDAAKPLSSQISAFNTKLVGLLQEIGIGRSDEGHTGEADWEMTLTFAENADGNIIVLSAELDSDENQQLTALINEDAELVEQIKSLSVALKEAKNPSEPQAVDPDPLGSAQPTGAYAKVDADGNKVPFVSLLDMDYESASLKEQNLIGWAKRLVAIHQWEQENDFSFRSSPTTPESKKTYNDMLLKAMQEGVQPLHGFRSSLNAVEGTDWMIADGAEALIGHEILNMFENTNTKFNPYAGQVNEYGFTISMPGSYQGTNYQTTNSIASQTESLRRVGNDVEILWDTQGVDPSEFIRSVDVPVENINVPMLGIDGGQTYSPEVHFRDALGLGGMSLAERKMFLELTQHILDNVMPGIDARELRFSTGYLNDADMRNGNLSLTIDVSGLSNEQRNTIEQALNQDRRLFDMKQRADMSGNQGLGEFSMSVLDAQSNALAKDQVRLISGGKSVITSVDSIKDMDQQQILGLINRSG
ncbi:MAG: hypothetical protein FWG73_00040 [Planctomycetaceae bacterium]|nr:hypothetical protein [Planctomycetaceae bacterium]